MKEFNLEEAKAGKSVCTKDGAKARIICFDRESNDYPIVALIEDGDEETVGTYAINGKYHTSDTKEDDVLDLMMETTKHTGWINIYQVESTTYPGQFIYI